MASSLMTTAMCVTLCYSSSLSGFPIMRCVLLSRNLPLKLKQKSYSARLSSPTLQKGEETRTKTQSVPAEEEN